MKFKLSGPPGKAKKKMKRGVTTESNTIWMTKGKKEQERQIRKI
jgi:hypothetical protein